jgi:hypothetical protein
VVIYRSAVTGFGANLGVKNWPNWGAISRFLRLNSVDPKKYSDRPYWSYESRLLAGADIASHDPQLYGLALTNFGCGPNSFILKELEDVMGGKPMGQLEIDEHAAEAGLVTRLEAFVDTIEDYSRSTKAKDGPAKNIYRGTTSAVSLGKTLIIPRMAPHADVLAAAMEAFGVKAVSLPEPDERNLLYSNPVTSGTECLPYRVTLGDFLRFYYENGHNIKNVEGFMTGAYGPCRLGKYAVEQIRILKDLGFDLQIRTTVSITLTVISALVQGSSDSPGRELRPLTTFRNCNGTSGLMKKKKAPPICFSTNI